MNTAQTMENFFPYKESQTDQNDKVETNLNSNSPVSSEKKVTTLQLQPSKKSILSRQSMKAKKVIVSKFDVYNHNRKIPNRYGRKDGMNRGPDPYNQLAEKYYGIQSGYLSLGSK